jgi:hypothetical protein
VYHSDGQAVGYILAECVNFDRAVFVAFLLYVKENFRCMPAAVAEMS